MSRWVVDDFISRAECRELVYVHRTGGVVGYRDRFSVTTLREPLAFAYDWPLLLPFVRLRDRLRDAVEERTGEHLSLFVEWTGLSCWHQHSSIPAHYDSNRPYLEQRHYSVVLYLNDAGREFDGGTFQFFDDKGNVEEEVRAAAGRLLIFASGPENVHGVTPITRGERFTFTVWLTRDEESWEDHKILAFLPASLPPSLALTPAAPAFLRPPTAKRSRGAAQATTQSSTRSDQGAGFDLEAEVLGQLEMVWARTRRTTGHARAAPPAKRLRSAADDEDRSEEARPGDLQSTSGVTDTDKSALGLDDDNNGDRKGEDDDDGDDDEAEEVVVQWRGRPVPLRFESVRRAVELVAFVTAHMDDDDDEAASQPLPMAEAEQEERWWRQRVDEWLAYRHRLAERLRVALPKWKEVGSFYDAGSVPAPTTL